MISNIKKVIKNKVNDLLGIRNILKKQDDLFMLLGNINISVIKNITNINSLDEVEFKVFSQWGEDGIVQYLINKINIPNKYFVEFGVGNYTESNTRFLLRNNNWSGLIIEASKADVDYIKKDDIYWKYDLNAINSFITKDNINSILRENINKKDIGLLSIDIDGNDYWIWKEVCAIKPRIVMCEYNSVFSNEYSITVPYDDNFNRTNKHYSNLYFGASLPALCDLAEQKGYDFIGCTSGGNDAFFVRKDLSKPFKLCGYKDGCILSRVRESRDINGNLSFISGDRRIKEIYNMDVVDLRTNKIVKIKELFEKFNIQLKK